MRCESDLKVMSDDGPWLTEKVHGFKRSSCLTHSTMKQLKACSSIANSAANAEVAGDTGGMPRTHWDTPVHVTTRASFHQDEDMARDGRR